jgi:predicted dehydrogenase
VGRLRHGRTAAGGGSAFLVAGCHAVDTLRWFAGAGEFEAAEPVEVFAYSGGKRLGRADQYSPLTQTWHEGEPSNIRALKSRWCVFANGVLGKVGVNFECIQPYAFPVRPVRRQGTLKNNRVWTPTGDGKTAWAGADRNRP